MTQLEWPDGLTVVQPRENMWKGVAAQLQIVREANASSSYPTQLTDRTAR